MLKHKWMIVIWFGLICILVMLASPALAQDGTPPAPTPGGPMADFTDRFAPPKMSNPPTQLERGASLFYLICMVCHGDKGQGLTDEWRSALDPPDRNCWQSKCHAANHPEDGFTFPKIVPPAVSPAVRGRFETALDMYNYLKTKMPWQAPGTRTEQEYQDLTVFLLKANGIDPGEEPFTPEKAALIRVRPLPATPTPQPWYAAVTQGSVSVMALAFGGLLIALILILFLVKWKRK